MTDTYSVHIVDDDATVRDSTAALLAVLGHDAILWDSGEQFLARSNPQPNEVILLDDRMGGMDGLEVLCRLNAWGVTTPLVVMTERTEREIEAEYLARGATWLLDKPFNLADLRRALTIAETAASRLACLRAGIAPVRRIEG